MFILWELSTPFLNFHWFFDKVKMTGSKAQLVNGIVLLATFFSVRLVWGSYQSIRIACDLLMSVNKTPSIALSLADEPASGAMRYVTSETTVPVWAAAAIILSNTVLNSLNFYWFRLMIKAVTKRFVKKPVDAKIIESEKSDGLSSANGDSGALRRRKE